MLNYVRTILEKIINKRFFPLLVEHLESIFNLIVFFFKSNSGQILIKEKTNRYQFISL